MKKLFLIDAYAMIYRAYYALIRAPRINSKGMNTSAVMGFVNILHEIISKEQPDYMAVAFDHGKTFRHDAFPQYKAQREETPEDIHRAVPIIKDILNAWHIPCLQTDGYEADDIIGTLAAAVAAANGRLDDSSGNAEGSSGNTGGSSGNNDGYDDASLDENGENRQIINTYMVTGDKDYGQLVRQNIFMYKPRHGGGYDVLGEKEICEKYSISSTAQVIDILALMGDSADNFPGCPGVGEKTAVKLINEWGSIDNLLLHATEVKGAIGKKIIEHEEDIRMSKFLATIVTDIKEVTDALPTLLHDMALQQPDKEKLTAIFDELEFKSLAKKILSDGNQSDQTADSDEEKTADSKTSRSVNKSKKIKTEDKNQLNFFAEFEGEGSEEEKNRLYFDINSVAHDYKLIDNEEDARKLCDFFLTNSLLCFDTETTSKSPIDAELVGMSFSVKENEAWYVSVPGKMEQMAEIFRPVFENAEIKKLGQNIKYDIEVLSKYGIEVKGEKFDTMIAHYLLQPELRHGMDYMAETILKYNTIHYDDIVPKGRTMAELSPTLVCDYACEDADITLQLWNKLQPRLMEQEGLWQLFTDIEMPLVDVLADMEMTGVAIDTGALSEVSKFFNERMKEHEQKIYALAGKQFNINSPRQVGEILFGEMKIIDKPKKTKTGQFVTSEDVLTSLRGEHEIVAEILDYRALKKLVGTYVDALPKLVNKRTGKIHTSFNQCVTATGRLSSSDPNLQNIPVRGEDGKEIRRCFIGGVKKMQQTHAELDLFAEPVAIPEEEDCLFFSADYSQIELRVMAHLSGDENMISAFQNGHDVHAATAATVYGKPMADVTRDERTKAKRANFGLIYGISAWGLSQSLMIDRKEARRLMDGFFETFPKVQQYMEESKAMAAEKGYAATLLHRRRYLADINSNNATVRGFAERNAINAPIQGTAADIIKIAMIRIHQRMKAEGLKAKMILQVHDELNFSVPAAEKEAVQRIVIEEMERAYPLRVPLVADYGWGDNWLEAH